MGAEAVVHVYSNDKPFWIVRCDECLTVLNSGHHYSGESLLHAERLADKHNEEKHS